MSLREAKKTETRRQIMKAVEASFRTVGFADTTVRAIARSVNITEPTFYNYFSDKNQVLDALAIEWMKASIQRVKTVDTVGSVKAGLKRYLMQQCDAILRDPDFARLVVTRSLLFNHRDGKDASVERKHSLAAFEALAVPIRHGQEIGEFRHDIDALDLAETLHGAVTFVIQLWVTDYWPQKKVPLKRKVQQTFDLLLGGWAPQ